MLRAGQETPILPIPEKVFAVPFVMRWISGRPTPSQVLLPRTLATVRALTSVLVALVVLVTDTHPSAMLMDAISTLIAWAT
jgi:hypothetical protein